jgi:hypothetical protein
MEGTSHVGCLHLTNTRDSFAHHHPCTIESARRITNAPIALRSLMATSLRVPQITVVSSAADSAALTVTHDLIKNATTGPLLLNFSHFSFYSDGRPSKRPTNIPANNWTPRCHANISLMHHIIIGRVMKENAQSKPEFIATGHENPSAKFPDTYICVVCTSGRESCSLARFLFPWDPERNE